MHEQHSLHRGPVSERRPFRNPFLELEKLPEIRRVEVSKLDGVPDPHLIDVSCFSIDPRFRPHVEKSIAALYTFLSLPIVVDIFTDHHDRRAWRDIRLDAEQRRAYESNKLRLNTIANLAVSRIEHLVENFEEDGENEIADAIKRIAERSPALREYHDPRLRREHIPTDEHLELVRALDLKCVDVLHELASYSRLRKEQQERERRTIRHDEPPQIM